MKSKLYLCITLSLFCLFCTLLCRKLNIYIPAKERIVYLTTKHDDDTIRIAYIGDSWALGHKNHNCTIAKRLEDTLHRPVYVNSYGIGGLTSKEIYNAIFEIESFRHFMERGYNYCFISAGINDCNKKMSKSYYKNSMECIIRFMLTNHIHPLILEIPNYNIQKVYETETAYNRMTRHISMHINGTSIDCKQQIREELNSLITDNNCIEDVSIIHYKSWNNNYAEDLINLYIDDQLHLNEKGYTKLDSVIALAIISHFKRKSHLY